MAWLGLFGGKQGALKKHAKRTADKRAQAQDRWESIVSLGKVATDDDTDPETRNEAITALLMRFTYYVDPSITDGEEKDEAFHWVTKCGEEALEPVRRALKQHDSPGWPLRILSALVPAETVVAEMLAVLARMDTDYERDPQKKIAILASLEEHQDVRIAKAVTPFLLDMNETCRFHALGAALAQENAADALGDMLGAFVEEDSRRVKLRLVEAMQDRGWVCSPEQVEAVKAALPEGANMDARGAMRVGAGQGTSEAKPRTAARAPTRGTARKRRR